MRHFRRHERERREPGHRPPRRRARHGPARPGPAPPGARPRDETPLDRGTLGGAAIPAAVPAASRQTEAAARRLAPAQPAAGPIPGLAARGLGGGLASSPLKCSPHEGLSGTGKRRPPKPDAALWVLGKAAAPQALSSTAGVGRWPRPDGRAGGSCSFARPWHLCRPGRAPRAHPLPLEREGEAGICTHLSG